jgi:hypothetical protein
VQGWAMDVVLLFVVGPLPKKKKEKEKNNNGVQSLSPFG